MGNGDGDKKISTVAGTENLSLNIPANALSRAGALGEEVELNLGLSQVPPSSSRAVCRQ